VKRSISCFYAAFIQVKASDGCIPDGPKVA